VEAPAAAPAAAAAPAPAEPPAPAPARPAPVAPAPPAPDPVAQSVRLLASGDRRYEAGDFAGAAAEYRRSLAARPGAPAFVGLARALYDSNPQNAGEALRALDGAIRLDPRYAQAWLLYGVIHQDEGRKAQARAAYEKFLQLQPNGPQAADVRQILAKQLR
jgi:tetratricopeptide (TPR) repeat protein